ncbi:bifunctional diguanylate cyclase/phosphodiesterase [Neobacillus sp. CF12]|uniref:sensor domain-containing protein n=1 Tax=Neobacillus sp. CF12 TaxID=3055864 RepID=UPI0025A2910E|nr:bifunctional diguanylate cyclase/phosphodiesterase [Neobacillus sp. CF12]MDM5331703.1 EAL domain-containing protein [Neobacillus sp. CF12]
MEEITLGVGLAIEIVLIIVTILIISSHLRKNSRNNKNLKLNEQYYKSLFEQNPDAIFIFDLNGKFVVANKAVSIYGYSIGELIDKPFADFILPNDIERVTAHFNVAAEGMATNYECSILDKEGLQREISVTNIPIFVNEQITGVYSIIKDITQHIKAQNLLMEAEAKYRSLIENSLVGVYIMQDGKLVYVNPRLCEMSGYKCEELLGLSVSEFIYPEDLPIVSENIRKRLSNETGMIKYEYRALRKDNSVITFELYGSKIVYNGRDAIIGTVIDITERKNTEKMIKHMAYHDQLTELPNRYLLREKVNEAIINSRKCNCHFALLFLDLDRFKAINDTMGHEIGDKVLIEIAERLKECVSDNDIISRYGGDEFSILLTDSEIRRASEVADKIITKLSSPITLYHHDLLVTPSIGITVFPTHGESFDTLIKNADLAMYHAKSLGRNNFQFFNEELNKIAQHELEMEVNLRKALEQNQLVLFYQPQVNLETNQIYGAEALMRWIHPEKGIIPPAVFIPIAEETGLIIPMGEWAIRTACKENKRWQSAGYSPITVSVNISAKQFFQSNLVEIVKDALTETGLEPRYLELEITESITMDVEHSISTLLELKNLGVKISIDDFGTGYSSLNYLRRLPIDKLKIDQSFIRECPDDLNSNTLVRTIIVMAHLLKLKVKAEGVETQEQISFLLQQGCKEAQGYYFSKPIPVLEFETKYMEKRLES